MTTDGTTGYSSGAARGAPMAAAGTVPARVDVPLAERWDLASVFPTEDAWEAAYRAADARLPEIERFRGRLGESAATLLAALRLGDELHEAVEKVQVFGELRRSEDNTDPANVAMDSRGAGLRARFEAARAFVPVEALQLPRETIATWLEEEPGLAIYRHAFDRLERRRPHVRSSDVEEVLAQASDLAGSPETIAVTLEDGELPLGTVRDEGGEVVALAQGNLDRYLRSPDRRVRQAAWEASADAYRAFEGTFAAALAGAVKKNVFYARAHRYASSLEAALARESVPPVVFHNLLKTVWRNLPTWQRYFRAKRRLLGLADGDFHGWDITAPLAPEPATPWDEGVALILDSLAPLGEEYVGLVRRGIDDRWVDRAANSGKGGGAFSWGSYRTKPFISMVYDGDLGSVSTLTHELGHSLHSHHAWESQPILYAEGGFLIEVPSNFHQALLGAHLLALREDRDWTIAVIEERMANHLRYLFTMPILARFELDCHERVERGEALTAEEMSEQLLGLYRQGYGEEVVLAEPDAERVAITWARFPHLYMNFYVYEYAIGIAGAAALARQVREEGAPAARRFVELLRAGGHGYPVELLEEAGVDMTSTEPVQAAFDVLAGYVERLEQFTGA
jgi:oligoendopeptidase F